MPGMEKQEPDLRDCKGHRDPREGITGNLTLRIMKDPGDRRDLDPRDYKGHRGKESSNLLDVVIVEQVTSMWNKCHGHLSLHHSMPTGYPVPDAAQCP